jgi:hypothetical protein
VGLHAFFVANRDAPQRLAEASRWVIFARDPAYFDVLEAEAGRFPKRSGRPLTRAVRLAPELISRTPLWTDDFSNVLALLRGPEGRR